MSEFFVNLLSNLASAAVIAIVTLVLWPSRKQIFAALRSWIRVKDVNLRLSDDSGAWYIEVPYEYVNDVKWRLHRYTLRPINEYSSLAASDHTQAFRWRSAAYDQSHEDDMVDIRRIFKRARIKLSPWSDWGGAKKDEE